jgi:hypothetical protein
MPNQMVLELKAQFSYMNNITKTYEVNPDANPKALKNNFDFNVDIGSEQVIETPRFNERQI